MTWRDDDVDDRNVSDDGIDPEGPDPSEMDADDEAGTIACPHCRKEIAEEAEWCPKCGKYISNEDARLRISAVQMIVILVILVGALLWWMNAAR